MIQRERWRDYTDRQSEGGEGRDRDTEGQTETDLHCNWPEKEVGGRDRD